MVRMWLQGDRERRARKRDKALRRIEGAQGIFDAVIDELIARADAVKAVHCYIDEQGDLRIVAA